MQRIGGNRRKTRHKLKKNFREAGKIKISEFMKTFNQGDKVALMAQSAYQKGMYHPRFYGHVGTVDSKQGNCYLVKIIDRSKPKQVLVHPVHLKRL